MIVPRSVRVRLEKDAEALDRLEQDVGETVFGYCVKHDCAFSKRKKTLASVAEKLETGRFAKWSELDDLYACVIIVPTLLEEPAAVDFLTGAFDLVRLTRPSDKQKRPDVFRFDSTRFIGRLRPISGDATRELTHQLQFEVQIVSAFEYAWQKATHALAYKTGELNWSTKRVAAQLRAAVEQLDLIVLGAARAAALVTPSPWPDLEEQREILDGFKALIDSDVIPEELTPDRWSRFAENVQSLLGQKRARTISVGALVSLCEAKARELTPLTFPRLVSLHQFVMGIMLENTRQQIPDGYTPLVTEEFKQVFPGVTGITGLALDG